MNKWFIHLLDSLFLLYDIDIEQESQSPGPETVWPVGKGVSAWASQYHRLKFKHQFFSLLAI